MESTEFFVSVIIPVYNGEAFLADAISSILRQNYEPMEIIVVDDGSTDGSAAIAKSFPKLVYLYQENQGHQVARNRGFQMARGDMISSLDADDLWSDDKLKLQLSCFQKNPWAEIVIGYTQRMQLINVKEGKHEFRNYEDPVLAMSFWASLMRKSVFDKVGLIDETFQKCDDWDWFMRAKELNIPMVVHKEVISFYRRHDDNMTNQVEAGNHYTMMMLKRSLDRRRVEEKGTARTLPKLSDFKID